MTPHKISYCPVCGKEGLKNKLKRYFCESCDFEIYFNVAAACAVIIEFEGKVITTVRKNEPQKGGLDLPGGFVDPFESIEEAIKREIKEELNLELLDLTYIGSAHNRYPYNGILYQTADSIFTARVKSLDGIQAQDDISDYRLISKDELIPEMFPFESIKEAIRIYRAIGL